MIENVIPHLFLSIVTDSLTLIVSTHKRLDYAIRNAHFPYVSIDPVVVLVVVHVFCKHICRHSTPLLPLPMPQRTGLRSTTLAVATSRIASCRFPTLARMIKTRWTSKKRNGLNKERKKDRKKEREREWIKEERERKKEGKKKKKNNRTKWFHTPTQTRVRRYEMSRGDRLESSAQSRRFEERATMRLVELTAG